MVLTLAAIGLVEVASASSVESVAAGANPYDLPLKQGMWTIAGIVLMLFLAGLREHHIRKLAWPMLITAVLSLVLVFTPLGMTVNAEGVETAGQLSALRAEGCAEVQGYLFSRPQPVSEVAAMLRLHGNATLPRPHVEAGRRVAEHLTAA